LAIKLQHPRTVRLALQGDASEQWFETAAFELKRTHVPGSGTSRPEMNPGAEQRKP